ncbi:MAG: hypothetical protein PHO02_06585 [Candidatus Nanoarchaeia archaeon]|nr:hypothetical protein [Candidatus Nanoarchaeia archaeon]
MRKKIMLLALLLLCVNIAYATELKGTIYNSQLELQKDAIVEINTEPGQSIVSKDGTYSFNAPEGNYLLSAKYLNGNDIELFAEEEVSMPAEGSYTIDIILFDYIADEEQIEMDISSGLEENNTFPVYFGIAFLAIIIAAAIFAILWMHKKTRQVQSHIETELSGEKELGDDLEKIISIIKAEGGRTTQLEIRKHIPLSEAKISLMIAELEDKKIVRKIKKGRGNIIILN